MTSVMVTVGPADAIDRASDQTMRVVSSMTSASISFTVPELAAGTNLPITIDFKYLGANGVQVDGVFTGIAFECVDPNLPGVTYIFPPYGTIDEPVEAEIGIKNYPVVNASTLDVSVGTGATLQRVDVLRSDADLTIVKVRMFATAVGDVVVSIAPTADATLALTATVKIYGADPRIITFTPMREYEYGHTTMTVEVINVVNGSIQPGAFVQFGMDFNATVHSIEYRKALPGANLTSAKLKLTLPTSDGAMTYTPMLHMTLGAMTTLMFPADFMFTAAPRAKLDRFEPEWVSIDAESQVRLSLENFPGADEASQIAVIFLWPAVDGNQAVAVATAAISMVQVNPKLEKTKVQNMEIDVITPFNSDVQEGNVQIFVLNTMYSTAFASATGFRFVDEARPRVIRAESDSEVGYDVVRVPMSIESEITVTVENAPMDVPVNEYHVKIGPSSTTVQILTASQGASGVLVDMSIPPSAEPKFLYAFVVFGNDAANTPGCDPSCCETYTCAAECNSGVMVSCFAVDMYDDSKPVVGFNSELRGPETGGTTIKTLIRNFPALPSDEAAFAYFGDPEDSTTPMGTIVPLFSNDGETQLIIITPAIDLDNAAQKAVEVTLYHPLRTDQAITFWFTYFAVLPYISSFTPSAGSNLGDTM
eukprot:2062084-Rhodomonas_salina.1